MKSIESSQESASHTDRSRGAGAGFLAVCIATILCLTLVTLPLRRASKAELDWIPEQP